MRQVTLRLLTASLMLFASLSAASIVSSAGANADVARRILAERHGQFPLVGQQQGNGSYITLCNDTHVTFLNFETLGCKGAYTQYSGVLNVCALEYIPFLHRNLSWTALCNATVMTYNNYNALNCTEDLLNRPYNLGACYDCPNSECKDKTVTPPNIFGPLSHELPWIENQWHADAGVAFVTSMNSGAVYRVRYNASGDCWNEKQCDARVEPWVTGFQSVSGISYDVKSRRGYALAVAYAPVETNFLIRFDTYAPELYSVIAVAPASLSLFGNLSLNGLARHETSQNIFYATNLGNFSEGAGSVLIVDTAAGVMRSFASGFTAADGAFVLNNKLYVSEVFSATVHVFDVKNATAPAKVASYRAPGASSLDDFFVATVDGIDTLYGADWVAGQVVSFAADGSSTNSSIHAAGLLHPTSVRPEVDADGVWRSNYVTVTQGGDYPAESRAANGGNVFRLRIKNLPPPQP